MRHRWRWIPIRHRIAARADHRCRRGGHHRRRLPAPSRHPVLDHRAEQRSRRRVVREPVSGLWCRHAEPLLLLLVRALRLDALLRQPQRPPSLPSRCGQGVRPRTSHPLRDVCGDGRVRRRHPGLDGGGRVGERIAPDARGRCRHQRGRRLRSSQAAFDDGLDNSRVRSTTPPGGTRMPSSKASVSAWSAPAQAPCNSCRLSPPACRS